MADTYWEKLKDPRWQKRRLEVMQRDGFSCQMCKSTTKTLNVHHGYYQGDPWDAPVACLWTLCEDCHDRARHEMDDLKHNIGHLHPENVYLLCNLLYLICCVDGPRTCGPRLQAFIDIMKNEQKS